MNVLKRSMIILATCLVLAFLNTAMAATRSFSSGAIEIEPWNRRVALVIGNASYKNNPLANTIHDAEDFSAMLESIGFRVIKVIDGDRATIRRSIRIFGDFLKDEGGVGLFYFAGHGAQVRGVNYIIPVDADIEREDEIESEAVNTEFVINKMVIARNWMNIVLLDACRDNPYKTYFRSAQIGLVEMTAPRGTLIGYSTAPGSVAADGKGRNGIYTKYLLKYFQKPDMEFLQAMKLVMRGVVEETNGKQIPWKSDNLTVDFYMNGSEVLTARTDGQQNYTGAIPAPQPQLSEKDDSWPWWVWAAAAAVLAGVVYQMNQSDDSDSGSNSGNGSEASCPSDECGSVTVTW